MRIRRYVEASRGDGDQTLNGVSYYWQNGKYYIYLKEDMNRKAKPLFIWDDVYRIQYFPEANVTLCFRDSRSFYCIRNGKLSREQKINDELFVHRISALGDNTISMEYYKPVPRWRPGKLAYLHYLVEEDRLVMIEDEDATKPSFKVIIPL